MTETILVAADGGEHAHHALQQALDLAKSNDGTLHILAVVDKRIHGEFGLSAEELVTVETEDRYEEFLADGSQRARDADVECITEVSHGVPHEEILEYADSIDADVIYVGVEGDHTDHIGGVGRKVQEQSRRTVQIVDASTAAQPEEHGDE